MTVRELIRKRLLGKEGPYADPRDAIDALDNVKSWIRSLGAKDRSEAYNHLVSLLLDEDPIVATGAVLALDLFTETNGAKQLADALRQDSPRWMRRPSGFNSASYTTLYEECFSRFVKLATDDSLAELIEFVFASNSPTLQSRMVYQMGARFSWFVVYAARQFLKHDECLVIPTLPTHWERIAVAGAIRPWPKEHVERVVNVLKWKSVHELDIEAIRRVMLDEYPQLTQPPELNRAGFWWIVAIDPHRWTIWESKDGELALETALSGIAFASTTRLLSSEEIVKFRHWKTQDLSDTRVPDFLIAIHS
jgi:hypothetical protein